MNQDNDILKSKLAEAELIMGEIIASAIEVHRHKGPGLIESIYEKCLMRELELRKFSAVQQLKVQIEYKGLIFEEPLRVDVLVNSCIILELKVVETILPVHVSQLLSYMKLLLIPAGLIINFHEPILKNGIRRVTLKEAYPKNSKVSMISL